MIVWNKVNISVIKGICINYTEEVICHKKMSYLSLKDEKYGRCKVKIKGIISPTGIYVRTMVGGCDDDWMLRIPCIKEYRSKTICPYYKEDTT